MSNEPITASKSPSIMSVSTQDAYGGTTDDWRQAQQAAREREDLKDADLVERSGHTSINSVSTLNLPPTTTTPTTNLSLGRSMSRMLLPDRDRPGRGQSSFITGQQGDDNTPEPTQGSTSLAKATVQPGGILAQLQAATEVGQVVDPAMGIRSQDGRYIKRSNTTPYSSGGENNKTIPEEDESEEVPLEYSKSDGYAVASRNRQQKRAQLLKQTSEQQQGSEPNQQQQSRNEPRHQAFNEQPYQHQQQQQQQQQHHEQQRAISRARAMSNESALDTNKDLPPTPGRITGFREQMGRVTPPDHTSSSHRRVDYRNQTQKQPRSRSESNTERRQPTQHTLPWNTTVATASQDYVLSFVRSMSPNRRKSHERTGSHGQCLPANGGQKERDRYGIDLLPLPVIPSPAEPFKKTNVGILPQDVLRTLDSKTIQKVITQSVIASRMYKALSFEELEGLKKEQEDLQKYVEQINMSLAIETRMRDASHSLIRLHESSTNMDAVKAATGQLNATTRKMDQIVKRTQNSMERLLVIQRLLLQHEGAVLNAGMRRLDGENRELSRVVLELEKARDLEKEEKLKWRKEHSQLRIQSMIFPNPPGLEDLAAINGGGSNGASNAAALGSEAPLRIRKSASGRKSPSKAQQQQIKDTSLPPLQQQQRDTRLAALENYMKELNDEITKKDERVIYLESQLRMIKVWADDFAGALRVKIDVDNSPDNVRPYKDSSSSPKLQMQLGQLQARIEDGFRAMEANAHELCIKAHEAEIARNKALEFTASTLANTSIVATQLSLARSSSSSNTSADSGELTLPSELRSQQQNPYYRQRGPYNRSRTGVNDMSGLNAAINESLLELDQQISSSSSSSISLVSSGTPPTSQDGINKGSRTRSPVQQRQRSRPRGGADQKQPPQDDLVIGDANEEIRRLNAMVDELERLVKLKTR
ncbi:Up-regulated during septation-domain-containing protein [Dissophora ornata]|nr:Up-regulated during septation-domain-containing protein [Dissophora ornata]